MVLLRFTLLLLVLKLNRADASCLGGEVLYNGICWHGPRRRIAPLVNPQPPPYVSEPPAVINISLGRQLFVDTFLINNSATTPPQSWRITYHQARYVDSEESLLSYSSPWESWSVQSLIQICPCGDYYLYFLFFRDRPLGNNSNNCSNGALATDRPYSGGLWKMADESFRLVRKLQI